ncbi:AMP-binding protein [Spongiimicrobium sp. 3-5]|uniref:AMP-binding protein n=1 Tax=Spongiimicrobium sp. 3-5 TaxID=3332596 RepID=UPI00397EA050
MTPNYRKIHNRFKLNGISYSKEELKEVSYSLVKEGNDEELLIGDFLLDWLSEAPTLTVQTSGSTGKPKILELSKQAMVHSAIATGDFFGLSVGNSALLCLSAANIAGKMMLVRAMILGLELTYVTPSSKPIKDNTTTYDFCAMVPLQAENSVDTIDCIETLIIGGAPISPELKKTFRSKKPRVFETYGMTETITHIAAKRINGKDASLEQVPFRVLPEVAISKDKRNCLVISAPHLTQEPVITNDIVILVSNSEFQWLGRYDNVINSGGVKLIPEQIEAKLSDLLSTRFFVAGVADPSLGHKLVLVLEGNTDTEKILSKIKASNKLTQYEIPKQIVSVNKFLETKTGKIQRKQTLDSIKELR